jgi:ABC-type uncharacterized transport system fused permease/ATPase subunit
VNIVKRKRGFIQKLLLAIAVISYLAAVACGVAAIYPGTGFRDEVVGSLMASVVFFIGVGIVLHVLANARLPDLSFKR